MQLQEFSLLYATRVKNDVLLSTVDVECRRMDITKNDSLLLFEIFNCLQGRMSYNNYYHTNRVSTQYVG